MSLEQAVQSLTQITENLLVEVNTRKLDLDAASSAAEESAISAATSATNASGSATTASNMASVTTTKATEASASATAAATSATNASAGASTATVKAAEALASANEAANIAGTVGVSSASVDGTGHLLITRNNNTVLDAGYVVGPVGPTGSQGEIGPQGIQGDKGDSFTVDATGLFAGRSSYDATPEGFSYLSTDTSELYIRQGVSGWSGAVPFGKGDTGATGPAGPVGPAGTTTWTGITDRPAVIAAGATQAEARTAISLDNVDNTSDANKPVSAAAQTALNLKANLASPALTGTPTAPTAAVNTNTTQLATTAFVNAEIANDAAPIAHVGSGGTAHTNVVAAGAAGFMSGADKTKLDGIAAGAQVNVVTSVAAKTGAVTLVKGDVGLGNVDNTSDASKPVSTATQTALNLKANLASPTFTGVAVAISSPASTGIAALSGSNPGYESMAQGSGDTAGAATIAFHRPSNHAVHFGLDTDNKLKVGGWSLGSTTYAIYHEGNKPTKGDVGLGNVDNTADTAKPVSTAQQAALNLKANLASPALTGTPTAPTAADGTSTTQLATTAFVQGAVGGYLSKSSTGGTLVLTATEASNPVIGINGALTSNLIVEIPVAAKRIYSIYNTTTGAFTVTIKHTGLTPAVLVAQGKRNIVYSNGVGVYDAITDFDAIALTGASTAATAAVGTNTTQIATTAFVNAEIASDIATKANLASPALTGVPTAPTAAVGANTTQLATTAFVNAEIANDAPTKTGGGASGTWPISISGQASRLDGSVQTIRTTLAGSTGNDYNNSALEVRGDGNSLVPAIGFHQPGKYAGVLQQQGDGWFAFLSQGLGAYQSLRVAELSASGNVTAYSDIRLKTDLIKIPDALNKVTSLNGYTYTRTDTGVRQTGVIAQELIEVLPEAVSTAGEHMSVAYGNMAGLLIEAIKELNEKVTVLTARVAELEAR